MLLLNTLLHRIGNASADCKATTIGSAFLKWSVCLDLRQVDSLCFKHPHYLFKGQDKIHITSHTFPAGFQLLCGARSDEDNLCVRLLLFDQPSGQYHRSQSHGNIRLEVREQLFRHNRPCRTAGGRHERLLSRYLAQEILSFLHCTKVSTDCNFNNIRKAKLL